jgi:hypothetical protein
MDTYQQLSFTHRACNRTCLQIVLFIGMIASLVPTLEISSVKAFDCTPGANSTCPAGQSEGQANPSPSTNNCTSEGCGTVSGGGSRSSISNGEPAHCDIAGYPSCYDLGWQAGSDHLGTTCPSGHSASYCKGYNDASSGCTRTYYGADCSKTYHNPIFNTSAYNLGIAGGKAAADRDIASCNVNHLKNLGTQEPSGDHTANYALGYQSGYSDEAGSSDINCPGFHHVG